MKGNLLHGNLFAPQYPMKWYKFQVKFALLFGAVLSVIQAFGYISGNLNKDEMDAIYAQFPAHKIVDVGFGFLMLIVVCFQVTTWHYLSNYKSKAPLFVVLLYALLGLGRILYQIGSYFAVTVSEQYKVLPHYDQRVIDRELMNSLLPQCIPALIVSFIYAVLNYVYYKKRKTLFIN